MGNLFGLKNKIFSVDSISTKITFNNKHKLLTGFLALVLVAGMTSPAFAGISEDKPPGAPRGVGIEDVIALVKRTHVNSLSECLQIGEHI